MNKLAEYKRVNLAYLIYIIASIVTLFTMVFLYYIGNDLDILSSFVDSLISEGIILLPPAIFFFCGKYEQGYAKRLGFKAMRLPTFGLVVLYSMLIIPVGTFFNSLSMLWVDNIVVETATSTLEDPWWLVILTSAVLPAVAEELVFRGYMYQGYRQNNAGLGAVILSAVAFACMHMNFNQAAYAIALGVLFALIMEATGSIWASIWCHFFFNAESTVLMLLIDHFYPGAYDDVSINRDEILSSLPGYAIAAVFTLALAILVLLFVAKMEGRLQNISYMFSKREEGEEKPKVLSVPMIVALIICIAMMFVFK